jgi:hypothetical protein
VSVPEVSVLGVGLLCSAGIGAAGARGGAPGTVPGFRARDHVANRKNIKLMARSVQLGVAAVGMALEREEHWTGVSPHRRGMYTGSNPLASEFGDLWPAIESATSEDGGFDLQRFAEHGVPLIHPLWLVKGLSNNVLGFSSAQHDFQGANANYCQDASSGLLALWEAALALCEDRADVVVAGSSDCLLGAEPLFPGRPLGEAAAFFLLGKPGIASPWRLRLAPPGEPVGYDEPELGYLGVAGPTVALARAALAGGRAGVMEAQHGITIFTT